MRAELGTHKVMLSLTVGEVNGRDELPLPDKAKFDVDYLQRRSFAFDLWILWLTLLKVLRRDDGSH